MITIGIDVGGSATKIVAFTEEGQLKAPLFVRATDPVTSIYGALGRFTAENGVLLSDIDRIMVTGAGASFIGEELYGQILINRKVLDYDLCRKLGRISEVVVIPVTCEEEYGIGASCVHMNVPEYYRSAPE